MNRRNIMLTAVIILGIMLAGITGYLVWSATHNRYVKAEDIGSFKDSAPDMEMSGGSGNPVQAEGRPEDGDSLHGNRGGNELWDSDGPWDPASEGQLAKAGDGQGPGTDGASLEDGLGTAANGQDQDMDNGEPGVDGAEDPVIHFVFAGDILLSDHVLGAYDKAGNISGVVDGTFRSIIDSSDVFMVNEEFPFSNRGAAAADKQFTFRLPPEKASIFQELGIDIVTLANNHALDFGTDALLDTCDTLDQAGIFRVGAGANLDEAKKPVIMEIKGKKIGFLGASRVIPVGSWNATANGPGMLTTYDPALLLEEIKKAKEACDFVIVYVHWGIERDERPQEYQRTMGKQYIDAGADMVIGSHPHVLQGMEYYKGKPIIYSLGNFIFGSSIPRTALLKADWDGEALSLEMVPGTSSGGYTRAITEDAKKQEFYQNMTSISYDVMVNEEIKALSEE